jgi:hypothetical protein
LARPENWYAGAGKTIDDTLCQGCFRPDYNQFDRLFFGNFYQRFDIGRLDIKVLCQLCRPGITRCTINFACFRTPGQLPYQRMLSGAIPDDQYLQCLSPGVIID